MGGSYSWEENGELPAAPRGGAGFFVLAVGCVCCAILILAAVGSI